MINYFLLTKNRGNILLYKIFYLFSSFNVIGFKKIDQIKIKKSFFQKIHI